MKGYHPEYKPHLRMAAARELIRQIEFDYDDEPPRSEPVSEPTSDDESLQSSSSTPDRHSREGGNPGERRGQALDSTDYEKTPDSDDNPISNSKLSIENSPTSKLPKLITNPYHAYADLYCVSNGESIYRSIIRRASDSPTLGNAKYKAGELIQDFNRFARECNPKHQPVSVPDDLLAKSLA